MKTVEQLNADIKYYTEIRNKAQRERRFRTVEGAQWNIDRCMDELNKLRG